jgi:transcriptional regulator with XRE-family HTH domain
MGQNAMMFGDVVRQKRLERGWSQAELAERVGVAINTVHGWERGTAPGISSLQALCVVLGVPLNELIACKFPADYRRSRVTV